MPSLNKHTKARLKYIDDKETELVGGVKKLQSRLWDKIEGLIAKLRTEDGKVSNTASNYSLLGQIRRIEKEIHDGPKKEIIANLLDNLLGQEKLVKKYFNEVLELNRPAVETKVHKSLLNRIGYDGDGFVKSGALYDLWNDDTEIRSIRAQTVKAIAGGQSFSQFQTQMRTLIIGDGEKPGISESVFRTVTMDMYAQNDRALTKHYADELGLDKFIFQGGLMNNTRDFCRQRNNGIFTRKEIEAWSKLSWEGKSKVYDPFLDVGGYRCKHCLDPVSDELAAEIERE